MQDKLFPHAQHLPTFFKAVAPIVPVSKDVMYWTQLKVFLEENVDFQRLELWPTQKLTCAGLVWIVIVQKGAGQQMIVRTDAALVLTVKAEQLAVKGRIKTDKGLRLFPAPGHYSTSSVISRLSDSRSVILTRMIP